MKTISVLIPTYNEVDNVLPLAAAIVGEFEKNLPQYEYELLFIDNCSQDGTRQKLKELCETNKRIKAIFNTRNFGQFNSPYYGLCQTTGDCTIAICADFQDPVELIPQLVHEWEKGHDVVCGIKTASKENHFVYFLRSVYYRLIKKMSQIEQIEHFTGFGLYDKSFIDLLRKLNDPIPFLRGIVAEYAKNRKDVPYTQQKRRAGKTKNNWYTLYDAAMLSFTSYTKVGLRLATFIGMVFSCLGFVVALVYLVLKLVFWNNFSAGLAPILIGVFMMSSVQLLFIGLLGEYIIHINTRVINRPLVVEEMRINFEKEK